MTRPDWVAQGDRRVGILGGTFDPIHYGHLVIAEQVREALALDRVLFVPARIPPHKPDAELTPATDRAAMVELEYVEYANEGHVWMQPANRLDFFARAEKLLARALQAP